MHSHKKEGFSILVNTFSRAFYDQFPPFIRLNIRRGFFLHLLVRKSLNHKNFRLLLSFVVQKHMHTQKLKVAVFSGDFVGIINEETHLFPLKVCAH